MKTIFKISAFCLSVIMVLGLFCSCAQKGDEEVSSNPLKMYGTEPDLEKLMKDIKEKTEIEGLTDLPESEFSARYGIDPSLVEKSACAISSSKPFDQEIIVIKARDDISYTHILSLLEVKLSLLQEASKGYPDKDRQAVESFKIMNNGRYLALFIAYKHKIAEDLFTKSF